MSFNNINWKKCKKKLQELQEKLVEAWNQGDIKKVKSIQNIITSSFWARALAVKKVVTNKGGKTPGIDNEIWNTESKRTQAIIKLKKIKKYKAKPLKKVLIPKKNGTKRTLLIPCLFDRAMQALYTFALDPISECVSDTRSYGYRKYRSTEDAKQYLHQILSNRNKPRWILQVDIKSFFENVSHNWILKNIPIQKNILQEFLKVGFLTYNKVLNTLSSTMGISQGSIISPIIANMVLNGLENVVKNSVSDIKLIKNKSTNNKVLNRPKVNIVRYVDDFIITAATKEILLEKVLPAINTFLLTRGLTLNIKKIKISNISKGFDFLGFNFRKYPTLFKASKEIFLIKPSKNSIESLKSRIKEILLNLKGSNNSSLILELNPILRGWANYYRKSNSSKTFKNIKNFLWLKIWNFLKRRDTKLGLREIRNRNYTKIGGRNWIFFGNKDGQPIYLFDISTVNIVPHTLCLDKNPYLKENSEYFAKRLKANLDHSLHDMKVKLLEKSKGICLVCSDSISSQDELEVHHIIPKSQGGPDTLNNLLLLHKVCHANVTFNTDPLLHARYIELGIIAKEIQFKDKSKKSKKSKLENPKP